MDHNIGADSVGDALRLPRPAKDFKAIGSLDALLSWSCRTDRMIALLCDPHDELGRR